MSFDLLKSERSRKGPMGTIACRPVPTKGRLNLSIPKASVSADTGVGPVLGQASAGSGAAQPSPRFRGGKSRELLWKQFWKRKCAGSD